MVVTSIEAGAGDGAAAGATGAGGGARGGARRRTSLDALRGIAVALVIAYHVDPVVVPGGFIGVDLFFVLSGYLITTLLLVEHGRSQRIDLRSFYVRRIRRLWPLGWTVVALICLAGLGNVWSPDQQRGLPSSALAAIAQVANWHQINSGGYVTAFVGPSPFQHYWSLAIEEQFFVVWPLVVMWLLRRRAAGWFPAGLVVMIVASVLANEAAGSFARGYLGSDTRVVALVIGAVLAWLLRVRPFEAPVGESRRWVLVAAGSVALVGFVALAFKVHPEGVTATFGGFAGLAVVGAVVVAAALCVDDGHPVVSALAWVGRISFALYLVHWPLIVALPLDVAPAVRWAVGFVVAPAVAYLLHRTVEQTFLHRRDTPAVRVAGAALLVAAIVALVVSVPQGKTVTEEVSESLDQGADPVDPIVPSTDPGGDPGGEQGVSVAGTTLPPCIPEVSTGPEFSSEYEFDEATVEELEDPGSVACAGQLKVLFVGDSTGRGAANGMRSLGDTRVLVWDRTTLGCSLGGEDCPNWRETWAEALAVADFDIVVMHHGLVSDFRDVDDPPFLSAAGEANRRAQLTEAVELMASGGATVYLVSPPTPLAPEGLFFCDGKKTNSPCDPTWNDAWRASILNVAADTGAQVLNTVGWEAARGRGTKDRPDGTHFTGSALTQYAQWMVGEFVAHSAG